MSDSLQDTGEKKSEIALREEEILDFWSNHKVFEKSLKKPAKKGDFVFYDGPPFATGLPHYGHLLAGTIKDVIPRYKTMQGYFVPRQWGWDCHGLPLENQIEKELGLKSKRDIEKLGIDVFNSAARSAVLRYAEEWKKIVPRFGRWVDMENDYRTMDATYTESVWWAFGELYNKGLVYEGFKVMQLCPRCGTTLSNFEVAQGYKDTVDLSVIVKLPLIGKENTFLLAWTTTPWTLPGNMAIAINKDVKYVKVLVGGERYIVAQERLDFLRTNVVVEEEFFGSELVGLTYSPPFSYFKNIKFENKENAWKVYHAPFVSMDDGTGIVHIAPAFGSDDLSLAQQHKIPVVHHVNKDGFFVPLIEVFAGMSAKPKDDPQSTDVAVIKYLAAEKLLFRKEKITHSYPHCWRCDTPLLNYAASSWFVQVSKKKNELVSENRRVKWIPESVGDKRFGNWLENARDWAVSRSRYWGAPIPVWRNEKTKRQVVIASIKDLRAYAKKSGNAYYVMRHGESEKNVKDIISYRVDDGYHLTEKGKADATRSAEGLRGAHITRVIASPLVRTQETARVVCEVLGLPQSVIKIDERLRDYENGPAFEGKSEASWWERYPDPCELYTIGPEGGESIREFQERIGEALYDIEHTYTNEVVLVVTHGWPAAMLTALTQGADKEKTCKILAEYRPNGGIKPAEVQKLDFVPLPHNRDYELDLHRPFIDRYQLIDKDGERLERVKDVFDCWFESGSMAFAQKHYPFENLESFNPRGGFLRRKVGYPANFIAEGLDQTRGWFYSLLVLGTLLFGRSPFQNVIVNGIVLAADGQKMSKKLKNYPDPMEVVNLYGADAVRVYMMASPIVRGEDLNFSERGVAEVASKLVNRFLNVYSFYELYKDQYDHDSFKSKSPLDEWINGRLAEVTFEITSALDAYELDRATKPLFEFLDDVSTWYLRRSRERLKKGGLDGAQAFYTLKEVILVFSKLLAPFAPFVSEYVYQKMRITSDPISVHLLDWPNSKKLDSREILIQMEEVRALVTQALDLRQKAGIKVRQPLSELRVKSTELRDKQDLLQIIADEVNVKKVIVDPTLTDTVLLDTTMTDELKEEGELRDLIREIQDLRKQAGLIPKDQAVLTVSSERLAFVEKHMEHIRRAAQIVRVQEGTLNVSKA